MSNNANKSRDDVPPPSIHDLLEAAIIARVAADPNLVDTLGPMLCSASCSVILDAIAAEPEWAGQDIESLVVSDLNVGYETREFTAEFCERTHRLVLLACQSPAEAIAA
jgi:hypothetical protein